jgi:hypothetical protein
LSSFFGFKLPEIPQYKLFIDNTFIIIITVFLILRKEV